MIDNREGPPKCFGKAWDDKVPACAGGLDPTYRDPDTGSHVRERCVFFTTCGARVQASRQQLIPQSQLVRPPQQQQMAYQPPTQPQQTAFPALSQAAQMAQLVRQMEEMQKLIQYQQAQLQGRGITNPLQPSQQLPMMSVEYRMPGYLTVPEPRTKSSSVWSLLSREIARSMFKSAGHTLASFWDTTPIGKEDDG